MTTNVGAALVGEWSEQSPSRLAQEVAAQLDGEAPQLVCAFAAPNWPLAKVSAALSDRFPSACVIAASSAGEFAGAGAAEQAACGWAVAGQFVVRAGFGSGLGASPERAVRSALADNASPIQGYGYRTALMLLDPLTGKGEEAALLAGAMLGPDVPIVGGAAGDDLKMDATQVALGSQVESDALVVAVIHSQSPLGIGVKHGHKPISDTLRATRASGSTVYEVDGVPAWDAWQRHTKRRASELGINVGTLSDKDVGGFLLRFEAGLPVGQELKIRAPLARGQDGALTFACGIPEGAAFHITEGEPHLQIQSAQTAASLAKDQLGGREVAGALIFDCSCRKLILGDEFAVAVKAICGTLGTERVAGFETYGEIALSPGDMSGFHNTTTVVLAFPR